MSMTYEEMMTIGESCGLTTIGECYDNISRHYDAFFNIENAEEELDKLRKDIYKKNPQDVIDGIRRNRT